MATNRYLVDATLLHGAIEALERVGCQFFACDGPTLDPIPMATCYVCAEIAQLRAVESTHLAGVAEIAALYAVTRQAVSNWASRNADFPAPVVDLAAGPVYDITQVKAWCAAHGRRA